MNRATFFSLYLAGLLAAVCQGQEAAPKAPPATEQIPAEKPANKQTSKPNRLAKETSPYLLQHAHNPVDWFPWGEEALAKAKAENKLIFLSIGYSSCHWCHVMERESFMDEEIAKYMSEHFVCIKVDREERPDIDSIYMMSLSAYNQLSGSGRGGGWPLTMFLLPNGNPFFGGTYFPARDGDRGAANGLLSVLKRVDEFWKEKPAQIQEDAETVTGMTKQLLEGKRVLIPVKLDDTLARAPHLELAEQFDSLYGGFGYSPTNPQQPKFPEPANLVYLLDEVRRSQDAEAAKMLYLTLEKLAAGGIRDHVGHGFHRYSVDRHWKIPHFEKMLYDNAQLASVYCEAYALTKRPEFRAMAESCLTLLQTEFKSPSGGFYTAIDADTDHEEGKFYRWEEKELAELFPASERSKLTSAVLAWMALTGEPNFDEHYFVPQWTQSLAKFAKEQSASPEEVTKTWEGIREKLSQARQKRKRPQTDTKVLTAENGLAIAAFADAGRLLQDPKYTQIAEETASFVLEKLQTADGKLLRTFSEGKARLPAYLNDYAYLSHGLLALHQTTGNDRWKQAARKITEKQIELFSDEKGGGFFFTAKDHEALLARGKEVVDGATPAGNTIAAGNLLRLARLEKDKDLLSRGELTLQAGAGMLQRSGASAPWLASYIPLWQEVHAELNGAPAAK
ncbi:MAG: thioredoxin domain-containing protein [Pirellulales bacterium]